MSIEELRAEVCRVFEASEGLPSGSATVISDVDHWLPWVAMAPADTVVTVGKREVDDRWAQSLTAAGLGEEQALQRLLACLRGDPVPAIGP